MKAATPIAYKVGDINGVPAWIPEDPNDGAPIMMQIPEQAMMRQVAARNPAAAPGTMEQVDPFGKGVAAIGNPPDGYQVQGGQMGPRAGGPADPFAPQKPPSGYAYQGAPGAAGGAAGAPGGAGGAGGVPAGAGGGPGGLQIQPGGPEDPKAPKNFAAAVKGAKSDVDPVLNNAQKVAQNYKAVKTGYDQQNGVGDVMIMNGLQRLIDDGVVRPQDADNMMRAQGLQGSVGGMMQFLNSGGQFTPEIREKMFRAATALHAELDRTFKARVMSQAPGFDAIYGEGSFAKYIVTDEFAGALGWSEAAPAAPGGARPPGGAPPAGWKGSQAQWGAVQQFKGSKAPGGSYENPYAVQTQKQYDALKPGAWFIDEDGARARKGGN